MAELVKMGSLYLSGGAVKCGAIANGRALKIGNTCKGKELSWVKVNDLFVADYAICTNASWKDLDSEGFIFGAPVQIDGTSYLCRSLKVGGEKGVPNEWDVVLDATGEDNSLWHWKNSFFWGQEGPKEYASDRVLRGCNSARYWHYISASYRSAYVGFRPVLEPLIPNNLIPESLIGNPVKVYGPGGNISGILTGVSIYDLLLSPVSNAAPVPTYKWCCQQEDGTIIVSRSAVHIAKEA